MKCYPLPALSEVVNKGKFLSLVNSSGLEPCMAPCYQPNQRLGNQSLDWNQWWTQKTVSWAEKTGSAEDHGYSWVWVFVASKGKKVEKFQPSQVRRATWGVWIWWQKKKWSLFSWRGMWSCTSLRWWLWQLQGILAHPCWKHTVGAFVPVTFLDAWVFRRVCRSEKVGEREKSWFLWRVPRSCSRARDPCLTLHNSPAIFQGRKAVGTGAVVFHMNLLLVALSRLLQPREKACSVGRD